MDDEPKEVVLYELPSGVFALMTPELWETMVKLSQIRRAKYTFIAQGEADAMRTLAQLHNVPLLRDDHDPFS